MKDRGLMVAAAVSFGFLAACETKDITRNGFVVTDSAGVLIAENFGESGGPEWVVEPEPAVTISTISHGELFAGLRERLHGVVDVLPTESGIVVAQSERVSFFDAEGRFEKSVGQEGDGPGDFKGIQRLFPLGPDSIGVWDGNDRLTILDLAGVVRRLVQPYPVLGHVVPIVGLPGDGTIVLTNGLDLASIYANGSGLQRQPLLVLRYSAQSGELLDTLSALPGSEFVAWVGGGTFSFRPLPFGPATVLAMSPGKLYGGTGDSPNVWAWDLASGTPVGAIRWEGAVVPVTVEDRAAYEEKSLAEARDQEAEAEMLESIEYPEQKASFTRLLADDNGRLWVREAAGPNHPTRDWTVFGPAGRRVGHVAFPNDFVLRAVLNDTAFGVREEERGLQSVVSYAWSSDQP